MESWTRLGEIVRLQIQTHEMTGEGGYDVSALRDCPKMRLTPDGVFGYHAGSWILDRHHRSHPAARHWHADDVLSFGFTSHYTHMENLFRPVPLGIGGENVIVRTGGMVELHDLAGGLRIDAVDARPEFVSPAVAEPCVEFSRFMTDRPHASAQEIKPFREQLKNGVRGYVVGVGEEEPIDISLGDVVYARATTP